MEPEDANRRAAEHLGQLFEAREWDAAGELFLEDFVADRPHTGEWIRGRDNFIALKRNYPEPWSIGVRRIVASGDQSCQRSPSRTGVSHAAVFFELGAGRIRRPVEYWVEGRSSPRPAWPWVDPTDGQSDLLSTSCAARSPARIAPFM